MTPESFSHLVERWGGDDEASRRLHIKPRTVRALRLGERPITERVAAFIALLVDPITASAVQPEEE